MAGIAVASLSLGAASIPVSAAGTSRPSSSRRREAENEFHQTNLVSDLPSVGAQVVDPNLKNPWGLAASPTSPLWVADNNGNVATVYSGDVNGSPIVGRGSPCPFRAVLRPVRCSTRPRASRSARQPTRHQRCSSSPPSPVRSPRGARAQLRHSSNSPLPPRCTRASPSPPAGTARCCTPRTSTTAPSTCSTARSVICDISVASTTENIPKGYAPFGIQQIHGRLYVSYAMQDADKHDDVKGGPRLHRHLHP